LPDNIATLNSASVDRLEDAGMVLTGKLATHEFARGGPTDDLAFPSAKNAWNVEYFAGGSSSGSGVAVASGMVALAMGSDTGGSVRIPAAFNGIVGLKPTYGRISRFGIIPLSFSMDHSDPLTGTVEDCALSLQVLAGHDPRDPNSSTAAVGDYSLHLRDGIRGMKIGRARKLDIQSKADPEEMQALDDAEKVFRSLGAEVVDIEMPDRDFMDAVALGNHPGRGCLRASARSADPPRGLAERIEAVHD
jgi:Asp-tRNAAsn/Glu-tRNAGln amidotransferase A subunit and related amidases